MYLKQVTNIQVRSILKFKNIKKKVFHLSFELLEKIFDRNFTV